MTSGRDDVAFADALATRAVETLPVRAGAIFASGFSNGGFMVSHLAAVGRTQLRGVAPTAGHEYVVRAKRPTPVFIHHCAADTLVNPLGCCDGGGSPFVNERRRSMTPRKLEPIFRVICRARRRATGMSTRQAKRGPSKRQGGGGLW